MLRRDLIAAGWNDRGIAAMAKSGSWERVRHGAYVDGVAWRSLDPAGRHEIRTRAVLKQCRTDMAASHASGLVLFDSPTWGLDLSEVDVTRTDGKTGRREAGVRQHRGTIVDGDAVERCGVPVMHPTRLALEATMFLGIEPALAVVNDLLHRGLTTPERLAERYGHGMECWAATRRTDIVLRLADARIESVGESRTVFMLWQYGRGIPEPQPNVEITDRRGRVVARVDFAWPQLGVFLEFDGREKYEKHRRPGESVTDCVLRERRRERMVEELTGWRCIRITWADLANPHATVARIRAALGLGAAA